MGRIIRYEIEKVLKNKMMIGTLLVSFIILFGIFFVGYEYSRFKLAESNNLKEGFASNINTIIDKKYKGDFTDEKIKLILNDSMQQFQAVKEKKSEHIPFYLFYWEVGDKFFANDTEQVYSKMIKSVEQGKRLSIQDVSVRSIKSHSFKTFTKPLTFGNFVSWTDLFKVSGSAFLLICILVIFICSFIFSEDTSQHMNQLLLLTKFGKSKMLYSKIIASMILGISVWLVFQFLNVFVFSMLYDTSAWNTSIQTNLSMELFQFPFEWNHLQVFLMLLCMQFGAIILVISATICISSYTKSSISAFVLSLTVYILPQLLLYIFRSGIVSKILYSFPINMTDTSKIITIWSSPNGYLFPQMGYNLSFLLFITVAFILILNYGCLRKMKKWKFS